MQVQKEPEIMLFQVETGHMVVIDVSGGPVSIYARDGENVITQLKPLGIVCSPKVARSVKQEEKRILRLATVNGREVE